MGQYVENLFLKPLQEYNCKVKEHHIYHRAGTYTAKYKSDKPISGVAINIMPEYYDMYLADILPGGFEALKEAFLYVNESPNIPELLLVLRQIERCRIEGAGTPLYFQGKVNEAVAIVLANAKEKKGVSQKPNREELMVLEKYLRENYQKDLSLETLSKISCMSVSKLKYSFKETYGVNISEYIRSIRIEKAKELLITGRYPISNIASMVGYKTQGALSKVFKENTGFCPKDFKKSL